MIGHSFGCQVIQRMCVLRPDILDRVSGFVFLMPYIRTKPSFAIDQRKLDFGGSQPEFLTFIATKISETLKSCSESAVRNVVRRSLDGGNGEDEKITSTTSRLIRNPVYPRNFFELGTEEIRDIPNEIDATAFLLLSSYRSSLLRGTKNSNRQHKRSTMEEEYRPISILHAGDNDQWSPSFHGDELVKLQSANILPRSIKMTNISGLRHDYVCQGQPVRSKVNDWIISNILEINDGIECFKKKAGGNSADGQLGVDVSRQKIIMHQSKL